MKYEMSVNWILSTPQGILTAKGFKLLFTWHQRTHANLHNWQAKGSSVSNLLSNTVRLTHWSDTHTSKNKNRPPVMEIRQMKPSVQTASIRSLLTN